MDKIALLDGDGLPIEFELESHPYALHFDTRLGRFRLAFRDHDTLAIGLPSNVAAGVGLTVSNLFPAGGAGNGDLINRRRALLHSSQRVRIEKHREEQGGVRHTLVVEGGEGVAIELAILRGDRTAEQVQPFPKTYASARARWRAWYEKVPPVSETLKAPYAYAWWVVANNMVAPLGRLEFEAMMPSKAQYYGVWNWDACFHALALRHRDPSLARDQLRVLLGEQNDEGMCPDVIHDEGIVDHLDHPIASAVTKPPVIAWAALKIHAVDPNPQFLREIYPDLKRLNSWWFTQRASDLQGMAHYSHPYSSGLDDSPLWDHGFPVVAPDLNTYLAIQMESLSAIAQLLGLANEAKSWRDGNHQLVRKMLDHLFDSSSGFFWPFHAGQPICERTPFNLYPLWTARLPEAIADLLVTRLSDPELFWGPYPLSTVARNAVSYSPMTMWRGPVWINLNYIFIEALRRVDRADLADELRRRTIELVAHNPGIYEYYNPETGRPPDTAAPIFGWTAALFIDLCIQQTRSENES
jgi:glycogen debranching enzyme